MIECTKEAFYRSISGPENIHPTSERERCVWKDQATDNVVGISTPGYLTGGEPSRYWLNTTFAAKKGVKQEHSHDRSRTT